MKRPPLLESLLALVVLANCAVVVSRLGSRPAPAARASVADAGSDPRPSPRRGRPPERSPFRFAYLSPVERNAESTPPPTPDVPRQPPPSLRLRAVAGGPPWNAVVEGLPASATARVVRVGDHIDGIVVRRIGEDGVEVSRGDSTILLLLPGRKP